jgi:hypothetical protein
MLSIGDSFAKKGLFRTVDASFKVGSSSDMIEVKKASALLASTQRVKQTTIL